MINWPEPVIGMREHFICK